MNFSFYLELGVKHILDIHAYDHMLFVLALCTVFSLKDWKKVLILLTAFTIGHSITLVLAGLKILNLPQDLIETLIPITILICALGNIFLASNTSKSKYNYGLALVFGFIHGAGFSNFFKHMLSVKEESIVAPLLAFNIGIELGQILFVLTYFLLLYLVKLLVSFREAKMKTGLNILIALTAVYMIFLAHA